ncbi:MAG: hypothetical protein Ta2E_01390 [Mycoplasmoidaceae bacterium]|nr:MAG: hypothetical protein Ta2E_01390 [Mycoplasmoidaceae bacterium]
MIANVLFKYLLMVLIGCLTSWIIILAIRFLRWFDVIPGYFDLMIGYSFENEFHLDDLISEIIFNNQIVIQAVNETDFLKTLKKNVVEDYEKEIKSKVNLKMLFEKGFGPREVRNLFLS